MLISIGLGLLFVLTLHYTIRHGDYLKIDSSIKHLIAGHSIPACSLSDEYIPGFLNISQDSEGYSFTFFKIKAAIEANPQIESVFVEYETSQIDEFAKHRIYGNYLRQNVPRHFGIMDLGPLVDYFIKNGELTEFVFVIRKTIEDNLAFIWKKDRNIPADIWDTHITPNVAFTGEVPTKDEEMVDSNSYIVFEENLTYLDSIVAFCQASNVKVYLFRSPTMEKKFKNELIFLDIAKTRYKNIPFLDFDQILLPVPAYCDIVHINVDGQRFLSKFFNSLAVDGVFDDPNYQAIIEERGKKLSEMDVSKDYILF